jgi:putative tricarboxylic transport membrane protein
MTTQEPGQGSHRRGWLLGPRLLALALLALGVVLIISALSVARGGGYQLIGPGTVPVIVAVGLLGVAAIFALRTTLVPDLDLAEKAAEEEAATHWPTVGLVMAALVGYALALDGFAIGPLDVPGLGYVVATGLFMPVMARILGSRSPLRDAIVGFALATTIYIGFTQVLGVRLPAGILGLFG